MNWIPNRHSEGEIVNWIPTRERLPDENTVVETKIHDGNGIRNQQQLKLISRLWFFPDGKMYVYYVPTHWRPLA